MSWRIYVGDCISVMESMGGASIDAIVSDPPYGIGFKGAAWDALPPGDAWAEQVYRVLKPGGHCIAFGGSRTVHRITTALEDAKMEIRDVINWLYYTGFPKNHSISLAIDKAEGVVREIIGTKKTGIAVPGEERHTIGGSKSIEVPVTAPASYLAKRWDGYGTALKPAYEPAVMARKPFVGSVMANVLTYGTGAINIKACRYRHDDPAWPGPSRSTVEIGKSEQLWGEDGAGPSSQDELGKWPSNIYQCAKPTRAEKERGCGHLGGRTSDHLSAGREDGKGASCFFNRGDDIKNFHPTVKPIRLMHWLCKLVGGMPGSTILDPFCGSGTTGVAAVGAGFDFIGIELDPSFAEIAANRIAGSAPLLSSIRWNDDGYWEGD